MTRIFLDEKEITAELEPGNDLRALFDQLNKLVTDRQLFLKEIDIDGETVPADQLDIDAWTKEKLAGVAELRIFSRTARALATDTVQGMMAYLDALPPHIMALVDEFRRGEESTAYSRQVELIKNLGYFFDLLNPVQQIGGFSFEDIVVDGRTATAVFEEFGEITKEMMECMEEVNSFLLSDLLEFEIIPQVGLFSKILAQTLPYLKE